MIVTHYPGFITPSSAGTVTVNDARQDCSNPGNICSVMLLTKLIFPYNPKKKSFCDIGKGINKKKLEVAKEHSTN